MTAKPIIGSGGRARLRALVVDDEQSLVGIVSSYLEREGFEVSAAFDGEQAVELARTERLDVIVLDLLLPGIDGVEPAVGSARSATPTSWC